jgi:HEPN domain-containing protein
MFEPWYLRAKNDLDWAEVAIERNDWPYVAFFASSLLKSLQKGFICFYWAKKLLKRIKLMKLRSRSKTVCQSL